MLNPLYTENYNHNVLISSAGVTITYKFTSFSLNPLLMRRLWRDFCLKLWVSFIGYHSKCRMNHIFITPNFGRTLIILLEITICTEVIAHKDSHDFTFRKPSLTISTTFTIAIIRMVNMDFYSVQHSNSCQTHQ